MNPNYLQPACNHRDEPTLSANISTRDEPRPRTALFSPDFLQVRQGQGSFRFACHIGDPALRKRMESSSVLSASSFSLRKRRISGRRASVRSASALGLYPTRVFVPAPNAPGIVQARCRTGVWIDIAGLPIPAWSLHGRNRASQVPWRSIYSFATFPRPRTARHAMAAFPVLPLLSQPRRHHH